MKFKRFYGILMDGKPLSVSFSSNGDAEFCNENSCSFTSYDDNIWLVDDIKIAEKAMVTDTDWYNSCHTSPRNYYCEIDSNGNKRPKKEVRNMEIFSVKIPFME